MARQYVSIADNKQHYDTTAALSSPGPCATNLLTIVVSGLRSGSHCGGAGTLVTALYQAVRVLCQGGTITTNKIGLHNNSTASLTRTWRRRKEEKDSHVSWLIGGQCCTRPGGLLALASYTHRVTFHLFWQHRNSQQPLIGVQRQI